MSRYTYPFPDAMAPTLLIGDATIEAAKLVFGQAHKAFRFLRPRKHAKTLRPGRDTPMWNTLRRQLRPHLRRYGDQVNLGRILGLPRQRINAFVTRRTEMPDAERTLQLLLWLIAARKNRRPA